ncbi:MAG: NAD(+) diphosphatase [Treponema sp.]|nr:NAD(+) diphosphatase [Treponema sp.]
MEKKAFFFQGSSLLLPEEPPVGGMDWEIPLSHAANFPQKQPTVERADSPDSEIYYVMVGIETTLPPRWQAIPVRQAVSLLSENAANGNIQNSRMLRAFHIAQWRHESRFCGSCGARNADSPDELARLCPSCGRMEYPRIAPAVIILITNDEDKALLAHNKKFNPGIYSLIAGFAEAGENLESAVAREIREEAGIEVRDIRYVISQPWPFPNSLMAGFSARYASGTVRPDGVEIEDAQWFGRGEMPMLPGHGSVSRYLIDQWMSRTLQP